MTYVFLLASAVCGACLCGREIEGFGDGGLNVDSRDAGFDAGPDAGFLDAGPDAGDAGPDGGLFEDAGPLTGTLWIYGSLGGDAVSLATSGYIPPDHICPYPDGGQEPGFGVGVVDGKGNLWVEPPNGPLYMWTAQQLDASCMSAPAITLQIAGRPPLPFDFVEAMAFDSEGNLWATTLWGSSLTSIVGYRAIDLLASGTISPAWILAWGSKACASVTPPWLFH